MDANAFAQQSARPSLTARAAAAHRAAHQSIDGGRIFRDPLALDILGDDAKAAIETLGDGRAAQRMRRFIAVRTRLAEEALHAAIERGVQQLVVLGAGLDTYAYRGEQRARLRSIFEVDHPGTQAWKRERLAAAGIAIPANVRFVPVNFEREALPQALDAAGFDASLGVFFMWLGVTPYLTQDAVAATLSWIGALPWAHVVFDYAEPPETLEADAREMHERHAQRVASAGESWRSYFEPATLHAQMRAWGFCTLHDLGPRGIVQLFFPGLAAQAPEHGGRVLHAATI